MWPSCTASRVNSFWRKKSKVKTQKSTVKNQILPAPSTQEAEACFRQALEIARRQNAKLWELRVALSLAGLWQQQDKVDEARELLQEIYDWFTEGFDTKDLQEVEALLVTLGGTEKSQKSKVKNQKLPTPNP